MLSKILFKRNRYFRGQWATVALGESADLLDQFPGNAQPQHWLAVAILRLVWLSLVRCVFPLLAHAKKCTKWTTQTQCLQKGYGLPQ